MKSETGYCYVLPHVGSAICMRGTQLVRKIDMGNGTASATKVAARKDNAAKMMNFKREVTLDMPGPRNFYLLLITYYLSLITLYYLLLVITYDCRKKAKKK